MPAAGPSLSVEGTVVSPPSRASRQPPRGRRSCRVPRLGPSRRCLCEDYRARCLFGDHRRARRVARANACRVLARVTLGWYHFRRPTRNAPLPDRRPHRRGAHKFIQSLGSSRTGSGDPVREYDAPVCLRARWPRRRGLWPRGLVEVRRATGCEVRCEDAPGQAHQHRQPREQVLRHAPQHTRKDRIRWEGRARAARQNPNGDGRPFALVSPPPPASSLFGLIRSSRLPTKSCSAGASRALGSPSDDAMPPPADAKTARFALEH